MLLCDFCVRITDLLILLYPTDNAQNFEHDSDIMERIYEYAEDLNEWHDRVPTFSSEHMQGETPDGVTTLFTSLLNINFQ